MKRFLIAAATAALIATPASAQGLLGKAKGALGLKSDTTSTETPSVDPALLQEGIVQTYWESSTKIMAAQLLLAEALGMKDQAETLKAEVASLQGGATEGKSALERNITVSNAVSAVIQEKLAAGTVVSGEGKAKFAASLLPFSQGVLRARSMPADLKAFTSTATSGSMLERASLVRKAGAVMYLAKEAPGYLKNTATTFSQIMKYAKKSGIAAPKESDEATKALDGF